MRRKSTEKTQTKNKISLGKLFFRVIILSLLGVFVWCLWSYTKPSYFPIRNIKVFSTYEHVDQGILQKTITDYLANGFFYLNVFGMKRELLKLPWVYKVAVERQWPDTVTVNITEQHAFLLWGESSLINPAGEVFSPPPSTFPQGLPMIFGPEAREYEIFVLYKKAQKLFEPLDLVIRQLVLRPRGYWEMLLSNDAVVYLKEEDLLGQIDLLVSIYRKITADYDTAPKSIDLRYKTGLAVKW